MNVSNCANRMDRWYLRLTAHGEIGISGEVAVDGTDLFGDVGEGFAEELEAVDFDFLEVVFGFLCALACVFEFLVGCFKAVLDSLEALDRSHVWCHVVEFTIQCFYAILKFFVKFVVITL